MSTKRQREKWRMLARQGAFNVSDGVNWLPLDFGAISDAAIRSAATVRGMEDVIEAQRKVNKLAEAMKIWPKK